MISILSRTTAIALGLTLATTPVFADVETRQPIKILLINSSDADFMAAVYGEIIEGMGYRVDYVEADYVAAFTAVAQGDIDVSLAAWQSTGAELTAEAIATGNVTDYGPTGVEVTEGWWYSNEVAEACPGLPDWTALQEASCVEALSTAETAPSGRYLDAPADWGTLSDQTIEELGLELEVINSGSAGTLIAAVQGSLDRSEPILAWGYLPHWLYAPDRGDFVELPGFQRGLDILKLGYTPTFDRAVMAGEVLDAFTISGTDVAAAMDLIDNEGMSLEDAATAWLDANQDVWTSWVPAD